MAVSIQRDAPQATVNVATGAGDSGRIMLTASPRQQRAPAFRQAKQAQPDVEDEDVEKMEQAMNDFANQAKIRSDDDGTEASSYGDEYSERDDYGDEDDVSESSMLAADPVYAPPQAEKPSPGFLSIEDEKADIMFRLELLRKQGFESRKFAVKHDIREMRAELARIKTHLELERSLKFSRKALVGIASALEFLNDKVDVLDLELDGWSEQMHQTVYTQKEYDDIFEELFFKYRGKMKTPPEIRLLMAVGGSALSFHITNSMIKRVSAPPPPQLSMTPPTMMQSPRIAPGAPIKPLQDQPVRREMRPPAFASAFAPQSQAAFANAFAPPNLPPFGIPVAAPPAPTRDSDARPAPSIQRRPPSVTGGDDDRLSDVPSELDSLPSRMSSLSLDDIKTVEMKTKGKKVEKRVIEI